MANLQYVGARYVPKFYENSSDPISTDWESNINYEAFTVVTYQGDSYTSKKAVPASVGNPVSNPEYWAKTGDFNASLLSLQSRVNTIDATLDKMVNRKFIFIGDSYAASHTDTWVEKACEYMGVTSYQNLAVSGTGFSGSGGLNGFKDQIINYTGDRSKITDIVVGGGLNDSNFNLPGSARTSLINNMQDFINYAKAQYPNAKLWLCYMGNAFDNSAVLSGRTIEKRRWAKSTYETEGGRRGFRVIPFGDDFLGASDMYMAADGVHPSTYGSQVLGIAVANGLMNMPSPTSRGYYPMNLTAIGNNEIYLNPNLHYDCENGYLELSAYNNMQINIGTDHPTISSNSWIDLFSFDGIFFNHMKTLATTGILSSTEIGGYCAVPVLLKFYQNKCSFKFYQTDEHGAHVSHTIPSYGGLFLDPFDFMVPSWYAL